MTDRHSAEGGWVGGSDEGSLFSSVHHIHFATSEKKTAGQHDDKRCAPTVEPIDSATTVGRALFRSRTDVARRCNVSCEFRIRWGANKNSVHRFTSESALTI